MNLSEKIKSMILSGIVEEQHRKIGVEIESFYYEKGDLSRLALENKNKYSAIDLLSDINKIAQANHKLIERKICKDNKEDIVLILKDWTNNKDIDVIITTGGTGLTGRDITPEAIEEIADKKIPGFGEVFRTISLKTVGTSSIQSRACAVLSNGKYIFALPGSSGGVTDAWDGILKHQLDINHKPCNFVELFPRLKEK